MDTSSGDPLLLAPVVVAVAVAAVQLTLMVMLLSLARDEDPMMKRIIMCLALV